MRSVYPGIALAAVISLAAGALPATAADTAPADGGYYTYHYDNARTGWNPTEKILSASVVRSSRFGRLRTLQTDGVVYAQPLYVPHLTTPIGVRNVAIVASENDSVYAYDADSGALVWKRSLVDPSRGETPFAVSSASGCQSITPTIGISSTPVIDAQTGLLYVVAKSQSGPADALTYHNKLFALRVSNGRDAVAPTEIGGTVTLEDGTQLPFIPQNQLNRPGLVFANGLLYIGFGSMCDRTPGSVHGWLFAYQAATLAPRAIFNTTSTSAQTYLGSIWQSTVAPAVDGSGNVYVSTGNGTFDADDGHHSYSESVLRLDPLLHLEDYFSPHTNAALTVYDQDVGSAGVMLVPSSATPGYHLAIAGEKDGTVYLLARDHLGGFSRSTDRVLQTLSLETAANALYGGPAYYDGRVYWGATQRPMYEFALRSNGAPQLTPVSKTHNIFPGEGGEIPAVSSDGTNYGSAVVWATTRVGNGQVFDLYAYDAYDLSKTLFSGSVGPWLSTGDAFLTPTVAGGHVFVPGAGMGVAEFGVR